MLKNSESRIIFVSGLIWFAVSLYLFPLGVRLLTATMEPPLDSQTFSLLTPLGHLLGGRTEAVIALLAFGLFIGYFKGRYVLGKSVEREVARIRSTHDVSFKHIYSKKQYIIIGSMVFIGMAVKFFGVPNDWRGTIDVAIGFALMNGGVAYLRQALLNLEAT